MSRTLTEDRAYSRRWWTLGVLCLSLLVIVVDTTIVNVALPTFARDLHASSSGLQWIVDAYTLTFAALLLLAGAIVVAAGLVVAFRALRPVRATAAAEVPAPAQTRVLEAVRG